MNGSPSHKPGSHVLHPLKRLRPDAGQPIKQSVAVVKTGRNQRVHKLFGLLRCDEVTDHTDITEVEIYRTADIFNFGFHIDVIVQHNPKALTGSGWNYVFVTYMELKITWEFCTRGSNNYKLVLLSLILSLFFVIQDLMSDIHD